MPARQQAFVTDIFRQRGEAEIVERPDKPRGDAAKAFAAAAVRHEAEYFIPIEYHNPMELFRRRQAHRLRQDAGRAECAEISLRRVPEEIRPDQGAVAVYGAEGQVAPNPESHAFRCRDLVPDPLGGDLPFDLGKGRAR